MLENKSIGASLFDADNDSEILTVVGVDDCASDVVANAGDGVVGTGVGRGEPFVSVGTGVGGNVVPGVVV